ncbi:hypothetical protein acdb102_48460 [Acidothermaceae bacterium B102]|nr:hypothetical protein acdb102_48460 [Acidothermaceae bacterium B102]
MTLSTLTTSLLTLGLAAAPAVATAVAPPGGWRWPITGTPVVSRPFQPPPHPWSAGHRGVDLAAAPDATVLAAGSGVVSFAGYLAGVGVVAVRHPGGLRTTYEPVVPGVTVGMAVAAGDPIGRLLPGHGECGPGRWCLHWGLLRGSVYLDPLTLVRRGPVRLLPLSSADLEVGLADRLTPSLQPTAVERRAGAAARGSATPRPELRAGATEHGHRVGRVAAATTAALTTTAALAGWRARRRGRLGVA